MVADRIMPTAATQRAERPRAAFAPERPNRLGVFRALTDREPADDPHWRDLDGPYRQPNFDTYNYNEVRLNIHLRKRERGSGGWVGVLAGAWRKLAVTDPAEAWERLSNLGLCPAPDADPQRAFADYCDACGGIGTVRTASGSRRACEGCSVARIGSRRRGCGYTLTDAPVGDDAINAVAHWAMLGTPTIKYGSTPGVTARACGGAVFRNSSTRWSPRARVAVTNSATRSR